MENNTFEMLLGDLYDKYNPDNKKEIPNIVKKYIGQELDAVYLFLTKYNYSKHPNYDSKLNELNNVKNLLVEYNSGNRILTKTNEPLPSIEEKVNKTISHTAENLNDSLKKAITEFKEEFLINIKNKPVPEEDNVEIKLNLLYTDSELQIPKEIKDCSIGTRLLLKDVDGKLIALEIKNVFCDFITLEEGKYIKEITIGNI